MNQILDYNPNKGSGSNKSSGSDKIVRVFAVILVIFALCLVGSGIYGIYKNQKKEAASEADTPTKASISVERDEEDDTKAIIKVSHDKAIEKVIYAWDNDKDIINKGNGQSTMEIEISLPAGTHTLTVKVTDIDGNDTTYDEEIYSENGEDKVNPEIQVTLDNATKQISVVATDETAIDYVTYRWNDEEETRVDADEEDQKEIKVDIEILKGTNDLTIVAVDKNNNSATKTEKYKGVTKPEITLTVSEDKKKVDVYCYHENGLQEITATINGDTRNVELPEETLQEASFTIELTEATSTVIVKAVSVDGTETEATEEISSEEEEDNIEISYEEYEDTSEKVKLIIKTSSGIAGGTVAINDQSFDLPDSVYGLTETPAIDIPLEEGETKVVVTVQTENGTEKTDEKVFTR